MNTLFLRVPPSGTVEAASWALIDDAGGLLSRGAAAAPWPAHDRACLVVPDSVVSYARAKLPEGKAARAGDALRFAIEDQVVDEIDELHVAALGAAGNGAELAAIVRQEWLRDSLAALARAGLRPELAVPYALLGTMAEGDWHVVWSRDGCVLRPSRREIVALDEPDAQHPPQLLGPALREREGLGDALRCVVVVAEDPAAVEASAWQQALGVPVRVLDRWQGVSVRDCADVNLLQGAFRPPRRVSFDWLDRLRAPAMAAALVLTLAVGLYGLYGLRLVAERWMIESRAHAALKDLFPDQGRPADPFGTMRRQVADLRHRAGIADSADLLPLLSRVVERGNHLKGGVRSLAYEGGRLELDVLFPNPDALAESAGSIRTAGLQVAVGDVQTGGNGQVGKLIISEAQSGH